jgi:hypothetical protein
MISWESKKQPIVSISSTEAEYVAATTKSCHAVWLKRLLMDFGYTTKEPILIFFDNNSAISLSKNIRKANTLILDFTSFVNL